jgi:hypothetical protein
MYLACIRNHGREFSDLLPHVLARNIIYIFQKNLECKLYSRELW